MITNRIFGILLTISMLFPFTGTYIWLSHQKKLVKKEVKGQLEAGMDKEKLILLKFTREEAKHNLKWEHSREFEYNDRMYDVVKMEEKGDKVYYYCWADEEETELNNRIRRLIARKLGNDTQKKENDSRLADFCKSLFPSEIVQWQALLFPENVKMISCQIFNYISCFISPPAPPP